MLYHLYDIKKQLDSYFYLCVYSDRCHLCGGPPICFGVFVFVVEFVHPCVGVSVSGLSDLQRQENITIYTPILQYSYHNLATMYNIQC